VTAVGFPAPQLGLRLARSWLRTREGIFEHRERVLAVVECPSCGLEQALSAETVTWKEKVPGSQVWRHTGYGPALGECCGQLLADWWEGSFAFRLPGGSARPRAGAAG
jgi:hypothetical protein